ncbi:MAG: ribosome silencing factor [Candidatus Aminicenantes bacterium]|nr:ribosome silencing factor [Candidatus Aminicenantes bacterium]
MKKTTKSAPKAAPAAKPGTFTKRQLPPGVRTAIQAAQEKKAENIVVLDLRSAASFTEYFLLLTGMNSRQTAALAEAIERDLKAVSLRPIGKEGAVRGEWILMDYGWLIVHIFSPAARDYYALEKLWGDAPSLSV